ncbi:MAG: BMP family ABC transporter substrate-binding protein [Deltaproteobacteria bacterium]|nr:BMP family ABC transporter substrate-binding protein [Deltaproteobacteria bacterium]
MRAFFSCHAVRITFVSTVLLACQSEETEKLKVGLVTDNVVADNTYNALAVEGCKKAAAEFKLTFDFIENLVPDTYMKNIGFFGDRKYDHVLTLAFTAGEATQAAAEKYPGTHFSILDFQYTDYPTSNLNGVAFREDQGGFLAGIIAAQLTQSKVVGCVGGMEIPAIFRFCNGFAQGVRHACKECEAITDFAGSFGSTADGELSAQRLLDKKVDVIFQAAGLTGSGAILYAAKKGAWVIGVDQDEYFTTFKGGEEPSAKKLLSSIIKRIDVAAYQTIKRTVDDTFERGSVTFGMKEDAFAAAPFHDAATAVPAGLQAALDDARKKLADGTLDTGVDPQTGLLKK